MPSIDRFCERMRYWCEDADLGYDQAQRWDIRDGGECDCSSLVIFALREAGFDTGAATYTGNLSAELRVRGWERVKPDGSPRKADILLNDACHVAVWLGDRLAQASIDENGNVAGGRSGDQSGRETNTRGYYDYPWDCYLRYAGESEDDMTPDELMKYSLKGDNGYTADIGRRICRLDDKTQTLVDQVKAMNKTLAAIAKKL